MIEFCMATSTSVMKKQRSILYAFLLFFLFISCNARVKFDSTEIQSENRFIDRAIGIRNNGNISYASSVVQILFRIDCVYEAISNFNEYHPPSNLSSNEIRLILGLKRLFQALQDQRVLTVRGSFFPDSRVQGQSGDSEEFLMSWMTLLRKIIPNKVISEGMLLSVVQKDVTSNNHVLAERSTQWDAIRVTFPEMRIAQNIKLTLSSLLSRVDGPFGVEKFVNPGYQDMGGADQIISRFNKITSLPKFLTISFTRTIYTPGKGVSKINSPVEIPEILYMTPYLDANFDSTIQTNYYLKMFIVHSGPVENGHYIAYVKDRASEWLMIDDEHVTKISTKLALSAAMNSSLCFFSSNRFNK